MRQDIPRICNAVGAKENPRNANQGERDANPDIFVKRRESVETSDVTKRLPDIFRPQRAD